MRRIIPHILIGLSFLYLPWYITVMLLISFVMMTGFFVEAFVWALLTDIIYGSTVSIWGVSYLFSLSAIIILPIVIVIRRKVSW